MKQLSKIVNTIADLNYYKKALKNDSRVCIDNFFTNDFAESLYLCLSNDIQWDLAYYFENKGKKLLFAEIKNLSEDALSNKITEIQSCRPDEYQFLYHAYMIVTAYLEGKNKGHLLHYFLEIINSPEYLEIIKGITGCENLLKIDAQATFYPKGSFLREHNDADSIEGRRFAYVLYMTRNWVADWGGLLHFTKNNKVIDSFVPTYNSLVIFEVPQTHFVSWVTPFAGEKRFAITGWIYDK